MRQSALEDRAAARILSSSGSRQTGEGRGIGLIIVEFILRKFIALLVSFSVKPNLFIRFFRTSCKICGDV